MKQTKSFLLMLLILLSSSANAFLVESRADYADGSYIEFTAVVPDSYTFVNGWNDFSTGLVYDSLSLTAYWWPDGILHNTTNGLELRLWEHDLDADTVYDGAEADGFSFHWNDFTWSDDTVYFYDYLYPPGSLEYISTSVNITVTPVSTIPVPAAVWLFGSGLIGLIGFARRKKSNV